MYILIYIYIYVYVCMHACMHACMYVCMYVCMYIYTLLHRLTWFLIHWRSGSVTTPLQHGRRPCPFGRKHLCQPLHFARAPSSTASHRLWAQGLGVLVGLVSRCFCFGKWSVRAAEVRGFQSSVGLGDSVDLKGECWTRKVQVAKVARNWDRKPPAQLATPHSCIMMPTNNT